jgi:hypothetical protein
MGKIDKPHCGVLNNQTKSNNSLVIIRLLIEIKKQVEGINREIKGSDELEAPKIKKCSNTQNTPHTTTTIEYLVNHRQKHWKIKTMKQSTTMYTLKTLQSSLTSTKLLAEQQAGGGG